MGSDLDPKTVNRVLEHMNQDHKASLLAYAWNLLGKYGAKRVKLESVDAKGFELKINDEPTLHRIDFDGGKSVESSQLRGKFVELHKKSMKPFIPPGPLPFLAFFGLYVMLPILAFPWWGSLVVPSEGQEHLSSLRDGTVAVAGSLANLTTIFYGAVGAHLVECAVAFWGLSSLKVGAKDTIIWLGLIFFVGGPALQWILTLRSASKNKAKTN